MGQRIGKAKIVPAPVRALVNLSPSAIQIIWDRFNIVADNWGITEAQFVLVLADLTSELALSSAALDSLARKAFHVLDTDTVSPLRGSLIYYFLLQKSWRAVLLFLEWHRGWFGVLGYARSVLRDGNRRQIKMYLLLAFLFYLFYIFLKEIVLLLFLSPFVCSCL